MSRGEKRGWLKKIWLFIQSFLLFFAMVAFVITCSFLLFFSGIELADDEIRRIAPVVFYNALILAGLFLASDFVRRKIMVERPVRQIRDALEQMMNGDFSVRLPESSYMGNADQFGEIRRSINRMAEELAGVETLRTDFIANVSHELKTPLAIIQNYASMLQGPGLSAAERLEYAAAITQASRRLTDLITNILKLNKLENQQIYPEAREYNLSEQLCECLLGFEDVLERKRLGVENRIQEDVWVKADPELLMLVWNNLFSNAVKFTPEGGSIGVELRVQTDCVEVAVSDTGCGMSPEVGRHIFEKFYQGDPSRASQGNGLGLALVKRVVDITQGEIRVESVPGKGSTFTVRLWRA